MSFYIGIDIGSTYTKYCVMNGGEITKLFSEVTPVRQKKYFEDVCEKLKIKYPNSKIISCGYGKKNIANAKNINELTALARGSFYVMPEFELVLDIGGQDTKIIRHENGILKEFFINDKCAAGSGIFFENTARLLGIDFKNINLYHAPQSNFVLSSVCAVFAQSEIVELIAANYDELEILRAALHQILTKAKALLSKMKAAPIFLTGGLTQIKGFKEFAESILKRDCVISNYYGTFLAAIGCALICQD